MIHIKEEVVVYHFKNGDEFFMSAKEKELWDSMVSLRSHYLEEYINMEIKMINFKDRLIKRHEDQFHLLEKLSYKI